MVIHLLHIPLGTADITFNPKHQMLGDIWHLIHIVNIIINIQIIIVNLENSFTIFLEQSLLVLLQNQFISNDFSIMEFCNHLIELLFGELVFELE